MNRRELLKDAAWAAVAPRAYSFFAPAKTGPRGDWFHKSPRIFLLDFQIPDPADQSVPGMPHFFGKLDTEKILAQVTAAHANGILAHTKCIEGNAYYNTRVGHKHSDLGSRDLMAEFSRLCRARGLTLLFYYQLGWNHRGFMEHPEWRAKDAQGQDVIARDETPLLLSRDERWHVCLNGPYRQYVKAMLGELSGGYDFDGYWLDGPRFPACYCHACKADYRRETGEEIPVKPMDTEGGRRFRQWLFSRSAAIMQELADHIHSFNPKLTVAANGLPFPGGRFSPFEVADPLDYVSHEYHYREGAGNLSLTAEKAACVKPGNPFEIEIWRFAYYGRESPSRTFQVRNSAVLTTEMATVAAHGGWPQFYDQIRYDGTLDPRSLAVLTPALEAVELRQPWARRGGPVPYALVLWSKATENHAPEDSRALHRDGLEGAQHALMECHVPVALITERDAAGGRWRGARVVVVPSAECLSAQCVSGLDEFVRQGGGVVVTNRSSLRDEVGALRDNFALSRVLGLDYAGMTEYLYTFFAVEERHPVSDGIWLGFPIAANRTLQTKVRAAAGATTLAWIVDGLPGFKMGTAPGRRTDTPAITVRTHGKGRVVYAAAALDAIYKRFSHADIRQLLVNAVKWAAGAPLPVSAEAPETVEILPWRDEKSKQTVIHVINRTGAGLAQGEGAMQHEIIPVHNVVLRVARSLAGKTATLQPGNRPARAKWTGDGLEITLDRVDAWEIVTIV